MKCYSIGEVARLLGVKPYIIRYWESELPLLAPRKSPSGRREYTSGEVRLLLKFKDLLYGKKFTVEGAKRRIWEELGGMVPEAGIKIAQVREELIEALMLVQGRKGGEMTEAALMEKYTALGQGRLFENWEARPAGMKKRLLEDLESLDASVLEELIKRLPRGSAQAEAPDHTTAIAPAPYVTRAEALSDNRARGEGEELIRRGKTAFLTVAGGQGSRLGFEGPKGMFPISPIRSLTLFNIFAEKLAAARRRYGAGIPWCIMTSPQNHAATVEYFRTQDFFGLGGDTVRFFDQGLLPSLSPRGEMLLTADGGLFFNPNGHGGVIEALRGSGVLRELMESGVEELFYFQVDNPLVTVPDPVFLGLHRRAGSKISSKVIEKAFPEEKLGSIVTRDGVPSVIEYSDMENELMQARQPDGKLTFLQGSIAIHILNAAFLLGKDLSLPYHVARKKVRTLDPRAAGLREGAEAADTVVREAIKFEMFIFDAIPLAGLALFMETDRVEEFSPLKNKEGVDSIQTCREGQVEKFSLWLEAAGLQVPRDGEGRPLHKVEISPLYAMDRGELASKAGLISKQVEGDLLLA